jgi:hypothetical protein
MIFLKNLKLKKKKIPLYPMGINIKLWGVLKNEWAANLGILFYGMPLKQKSQMVLGKVPFDYTRKIGTNLFYASLKIKFFPLIKALFLSKISCLGLQGAHNLFMGPHVVHQFV